LLQELCNLDDRRRTPASTFQLVLALRSLLHRMPLPMMVLVVPLKKAKKEMWEAKRINESQYSES
jgi:hypothetical protein